MVFLSITSLSADRMFDGIAGGLRMVVAVVEFVVDVGGDVNASGILVSCYSIMTIWYVVVESYLL